MTVSQNTADVNNQFAADWPAGPHDGPETIDDELYAFAGKLVGEVDEGSAVSAGIRLSTREKKHTRHSWNQFTPAGGLLIPAGMLSSYEVHAFTVPPVLNGNFEELAEYLYGGFSDPGGSEALANRWSVQAPFSFVTALENFGIYSNYAYIDPDVQEFYPWWDPLDASGIAENTATVDLWYSGERFEARLGYKYQSEYTLIYGWTGSDVRTLESEGILGLSLSYQFTDNWGTRFQVNNLTDEPLRVYRDNDPDRLGRYDEYGRYHLVDVTFSFQAAAWSIAAAIDGRGHAAARVSRPCWHSARRPCSRRS